MKLFSLALVLSLGCLTLHADESAPSPSGKSIIITGDITHFKTPLRVKGEGVPNDGTYNEEVYGNSFTTKVAGLPSGTYTIEIDLAELFFQGPGQRIMKITSGDTVLADNLDLFAVAGFAKPYKVQAKIAHQDDAVHGPLAITFAAIKNKAKFNAIHVFDAAGKEIASVMAGDLAVPLLPSRPVHAWQSDQGNGTYKNPVLFADYSDPDVIREGTNFYMVSSSFHYMPGIPILQSSDLINWKIIGHVFPRLDVSPAYSMQQGDRYGSGCWAPAIRFHNHRFYVYFPTPDEGIFMSSAARAEGPWTSPVRVISQGGLEDPCPFWDEDGSAYLIHGRCGAGPLILHRMSKDGTAVLDEGKVIAVDAKNVPVLEGPKLYKRHGFYYIFAPVGGVDGGSEAVLRSKNIYGPYDYKIVLSQGSTQINGPHQGGYVETPSGQGWFFHFQSRGAYGRIDHLEPVTWADDWPVMGEPDPSGKAAWSPQPSDAAAVIGRGVPGPVGQPVLIHAKPDVPQGPIQTPQTSDEFDGPDLGLQWEWNHNPVDEKWSLVQRPGFLRLQALPASDLLHARNTLTQMLADPEMEATTLLDTKAMADHQKAGLCMLCATPSWIGVVQEGGHRHIILQSGTREKAGPELVQDTIQLRVHIAADQTASYSYSLDGREFIPIGAPTQIVFSWWKGARPGLFSFNTDPSGSNLGTADFDWFHYDPITSYAEGVER